MCAVHTQCTDPQEPRAPSAWCCPGHTLGQTMSSGSVSCPPARGHLPAAPPPCRQPRARCPDVGLPLRAHGRALPSLPSAAPARWDARWAPKTLAQRGRQGRSPPHLLSARERTLGGTEPGDLIPVPSLSHCPAGTAGPGVGRRRRRVRGKVSPQPRSLPPR